MLDRYISELQKRGDCPPLSTGFLTVHELAVEEARRLSHHFFGREHQLLGLVRYGAGNFGININTARAKLERVAGKGWAFEGTEGGLTMTDRARRVITFSIEASDLLKSRQLDSGHLLLGFVAEAQAYGRGVLDEGLDLELIRETELRRRLPDYKPQNLNILLSSIL